MKGASIIPDHFAQKRWGSGAFSSKDSGIRSQACGEHRENVAEAAVMLSMDGQKLFHLHFNDNYRSWDDDMIVGPVHFVEYVELLFWLRETGYAGWYSMDQYPYRKDAQGALRESIEFLKAIDRRLDDDAMKEMREVVRTGDAVKSTKWIRQRFFP